MKPKTLKTDLRETLHAIACHLDELSIHPAATDAQGRHIADAIRTLIPAFTIRSAADMEALGELLARHEATIPRSSRRRKTADGEQPTAATPENATPAEPPATPAAAPEPAADDTPNLLDPDLAYAHTSNGEPISLIRMLAMAYFKTTGYSIATKDSDVKSSAGYSGLSMALKAVLLILLDTEDSAAGLGGLLAWSGTEEAPEDWQKQLLEMEVSTDLLGLNNDELDRFFGRK